MSETIITSVADFHAQLQQLVPADGVCLYRGQADGGWPVSCAAARRLTENAASPIENRLIGSLLPGNMEFLIARVRRAGLLPQGLGADASDLEVLEQLQRQGAATGLIDFTRQPLAALWFACNGSRTQDGRSFSSPVRQPRRSAAAASLRIQGYGRSLRGIIFGRGSRARSASAWPRITRSMSWASR